MFKHLVVIAIVFLVPSAFWAPAAVSDDCITGEITAEMETTGPYAGLYKYTLSVSWTSDKGLSHVTVDFGLGSCVELACASTWIFPDPAGTGSGGEETDGRVKRGGRGGDENGGDCNFIFEGEFNCKGDPSIDYPHPVLKWDVVDGGPCEAGKSGSATLCFYTDIPPSYGQSATAFNKNGRGVCDGSLTGAFPVICPVNTLDTGWGRLKLLFGSE